MTTPDYPIFANSTQYRRSPPGDQPDSRPGGARRATISTTSRSCRRARRRAPASPTTAAARSRSSPAAGACRTWLRSRSHWRQSVSGAEVTTGASVSVVAFGQFT